MTRASLALSLAVLLAALLVAPTVSDASRVKLVRPGALLRQAGRQAIAMTPGPAVKLAGARLFDPASGHETGASRSLNPGQQVVHLPTGPIFGHGRVSEVVVAQEFDARALTAGGTIHAPGHTMIVGRFPKGSIVTRTGGIVGPPERMLTQRGSSSAFVALTVGQRYQVIYPGASQRVDLEIAP